MSTPFFSIIIPTYNRSHTLSRSIDSVLGQTYKNFELIIIDNGSTDGTQQWLLDNYNDDRINYHYKKGSGSPARPRNRGIALSKGLWICFLDSDDGWDKNKLLCVLNAIHSASNVDVICHNENLYFEMTNIQGKELKYGPASNQMYKDMLIYGNRLSTSATSIRAKFLRDNNLKFNELSMFSTVEDYDLWLNIAKCDAKFIFLKQSLGFYTIGESNMIANSKLFCINLNNLLKMHAFDIQQFTEDRNKLWKLLELRIEIIKLKLVEVSLLKKIIGIAKLMIMHPINLTRIIGGNFKAKLTN
jgi:glycosyltransferase involved in cell wall biosynthesis